MGNSEVKKDRYSKMIQVLREGIIVALAFPLTVGILLSLLSGVAQSQAPGNRIGINPEYAFPTKDTPAGVEVKSASLVENANLWNGRMITFKGEAIGECMVRGKMAWIHLNDDAYMEKNIEEGAALGGYNSGHAVWVSAEMARKIRFFGDFKHDGDIVKVAGVFNAACREHGGDMDIHASSMEILRVGYPVPHIVNKHRALVAVLLFFFAGGFYGVRRIAERRRI
jgi:hypothetical protein